MKDQRLSNFELLRIISIFMILMMHGYYQCTVHASIISYATEIIGAVINTVGNVAVSCFVLISGYFGVKKKKTRINELIIVTTLYSFFLSLMHPLEQLNLREIFNSFLAIPNCRYWFINCYLILMIVSPIINEGVAKLTKTEYEYILLALFLFFNIFPYMSDYQTVVTNGGKSLSYFIYIYLIGRYIRLHQDIYVKPLLTVLFFIVVSVISFCVYRFVQNINGDYFIDILYDCSPLMLLSSLSVFYFFKSIDFTSSVVNKISSTVFAMYILDPLRNYVERFTKASCNTDQGQFLFDLSH